MKLSDLAALSLTYTEVGATQGPLPAGYHHVQKSAVIGRGRSRFEDAADKGMRWGMLRGAGLRVEATSDVAEESGVREEQQALDIAVSGVEMTTTGR